MVFVVLYFGTCHKKLINCRLCGGIMKKRTYKPKYKKQRKKYTITKTL